MLPSQSMYETARSLPFEAGPTPWSNPTGKVRDQHVLEAVSPEFDCVIVGAGFTGLACARRLATFRPDWKIAVLDALCVGEGSSGRNSGFVMDAGHWQPGWCDDANRAVSELSVHGSLILRYVVHQQAIECDWQDGQRFHVAVNSRGRKALARFAEGMARIGRPMQPVDADEFSQKVGTSYYCEALESTAGALVNPAQLVRGIARGLADSVHLYEREPVVSMQPSKTGMGYELHTPQNRVRARRIVAATNAFLDAFGLGSSRILPFSTFASITEALPEPPGTLAQWGLVPEDKMGSTMRLTADRRLLIRNGVTLSGSRPHSDADLEKATHLHRDSLARRFPDLAELPFSHSWGGLVGAASNGGTIFGSFADGAWLAGVHNGVGMAMGTALGDILAHQIVDAKHPLLKSTARLPKPSWIPPQPLLSLGVAAYTRWLAWRSGSEK